MQGRLNAWIAIHSAARCIRSHHGNAFEYLYSFKQIPVHLRVFPMQNGYDLNLYSRRILLLPTMYNCGWAGLGSMGCGGSCYVFMNVRMGIPRSRRHAWDGQFGEAVACQR